MSLNLSLFYTAQTLLGYSCSIFFLYVVYYKSTAEMRNYKWILFKLGICDLMFGLSLSVLVRPDLLLPLTAAAIRSPIGGINEDTGFIAVSVALCCTVTVYTSINDCCFVRAFTFYQLDHLIDFTYSRRGIISCVLFNVLVFIVIVVPLRIAVNTNEEFLQDVRAAGKEGILGEYYTRPSTVYFYIDIWRWQIIPLALVLAALVGAMHLLNGLTSLLVWLAINKRKDQMSMRTFRNQRALTLFVVSQNAYPALSLTSPIALTCFSYFLGVDSMWLSSIMKSFVSIVVVSYPLISVLSSFIFIRPYRRYIMSLWPEGERSKVSMMATVDIGSQSDVKSSKATASLQLLAVDQRRADSSGSRA